jgi:hypothetical protein
MNCCCNRLVCKHQRVLFHQLQDLLVDQNNMMSLSYIVLQCRMPEDGWMGLYITFNSNGTTALETLNLNI